MLLALRALKGFAHVTGLSTFDSKPVHLFVIFCLFDNLKT